MLSKMFLKQTGYPFNLKSFKIQRQNGTERKTINQRMSINVTKNV